MNVELPHRTNYFAVMSDTKMFHVYVLKNKSSFRLRFYLEKFPSFRPVTWRHRSSWEHLFVGLTPFCFSLLFVPLFLSYYLFPSCSLSLTYCSLFSFNFPPLSITVFSLPSSFVSLSLLLSSLSCLRGCWRRFSIWRSQFCLRRRESVTWRISFPSTPMAPPDGHVNTPCEELVIFRVFRTIETRLPRTRGEANSLTVFKGAIVLEYECETDLSKLHPTALWLMLHNSHSSLT